MIKNKLRVLLIFLLLFVAPVAMAERITGVVIDGKSGERLSSASVVINSGEYGTVTNKRGEFQFQNIPEGKYRLSVSMVGFLKQFRNIVVQKNRDLTLTITLLQDNKKLNEVLILGNFSQERIIENPICEQASLMPVLSKVTNTEMQKQGAITLVDAMKYIPGGWTETRGRKVKQFFSIRGQKYPYPSYSINGIWQKEFHEMPYFFNSSNIEEIQIVRSSSALLKGLSSLNGVIDVKTKQPGKNEVDVFAKYGSMNTYYTGGSYGNSTEKFAYSAGINASGTHGPDGTNGKENVYNGHGYFDWKLSDKLSWSANMFFLSGMRELIQPIKPARAKFRKVKESYDPIESLMLANKLRYKSCGKYSGELYVNYAHRSPKYHNKNISTREVIQYDETDWELTINQINALALNENNTLRFGALYNYWIAPEGKRFYAGKKGEVHTISGVVTDQHNFGHLLFDAGFRLTQEYYAEWGGFNIEGSGGKFSKVEPIVDEWQKPVWQATAGLSYFLPAHSSLHFSAAAGIINPRKGALNEAGETPDNETRINIDLGYLKNFGNGGKLSVTTFFVNRKQAIGYSGQTIELNDAQIMELYENTDKRNFGLETEFRSSVIKNYLSFFTNVTYMKGEENSDDGDWKKNDEMPNFIANAGTNFQKNHFDVNTYLHFTGKYKGDRFIDKKYIAEYGKVPLGEFLTLDVTTGYKFGKKQQNRIFVEGKNLFDKKFQTVPGFPDYGRIVSLGIHVKL